MPTDTIECTSVSGATQDSPHTNSETPSTLPQFKTVDDFVSQGDEYRAIGMLIHNVLAICDERRAIVRYGNGSPKAGNPRKYWLTVNSEVRGQYSGGVTVARFRAHSETEVIEKAVKALVKYLDATTESGVR